MNLSHGRPFMALPGPSVIPDAVLQAMHRPAPDIYAPDLKELADSLIPDLCYVAQTDGSVAIYISNGHGVWEAALANTLAAGDTVLVPVTGAFGHGWADMATGLGIRTQIIDHGRTSPIDPEKVRAALLADTGQQIKAVLAVHVDTSTSVRSDIAQLRAVLDDVGHPALLMADCIASLACDEFHMDTYGADLMVAGCQKGLMVPPGLGFVFFNARAAEQRKSLPCVSRYWDWSPRIDAEMLYQYFGGTAPTHHLYGLRTALDMIRAEGLEAIWARHRTLAQAIWAAAEHWGQDGAFKLNIADPSVRSHAVTSAHLAPPDAHRLRDWCTREAGVSLGVGLGMSTPEDPNASGSFRLGHMGHVNTPMILGVIGTVETGLAALGIAHQSGGVSAAAKVLAAQ